MTRDDLVRSCRVPDSVAERRVGLWEIRRYGFSENLPAITRQFLQLGDFSNYVALHRDTMETLNRDYGEVVMEDTPRELRRHLPILLAASGRVLVSGLGLGCVLRGLLAKPSVTHVDVVEVDPSIVDLVGREFAWNPRVTLHIGDAESIEWPTGTRWDYAWHDVWSETEALEIVHARLLVRYEQWCQRQGVWQMRRDIKRFLPRWYLGARRRRRAA